jgi:uncharacterized protein involved in exopolysaccharide biosynthesis
MSSLTPHGTRPAATTLLLDGHGPASPNGRPQWLAQEPGVVARAGRTVRNRASVLIATVVLCALGGLALAVVQGSENRATASLLFKGPGGGRAIDTQKQLLELPRVAQRASRALGGNPDAAEIANAVRVEPREGANVVAVEAFAGSADQAVRIANAYAEAAITVARSVGSPAPRLVQRAGGSVASSSPQLLRNLGLGLLAGLLLGPALAVFLEKLDRRPEEQRGDGADLRAASAVADPAQAAP